MQRIKSVMIMDQAWATRVLVSACAIFLTATCGCCEERAAPTEPLSGVAATIVYMTSVGGGANDVLRFQYPANSSSRTSIRLTGADVPVLTLAVSKQGRLAALSLPDADELLSFELATGRLVSRISVESTDVVSAAWSSNGDRLAIIEWRERALSLSIKSHQLDEEAHIQIETALTSRPDFIAVSWSANDHSIAISTSPGSSKIVENCIIFDIADHSTRVFDVANAYFLGNDVLAVTDKADEDELIAETDGPGVFVIKIDGDRISSRTLLPTSSEPLASDATAGLLLARQAHTNTQFPSDTVGLRIWDAQGRSSTLLGGPCPDDVGLFPSSGPYLLVGDGELTW
jgi:hypothetical protein